MKISNNTFKLKLKQFIFLFDSHNISSEQKSSDQMALQFWGTELNRGEDELSSPGKHIHPSQSIELFHQVQALSHKLMTAK